MLIMSSKSLRRKMFFSFAMKVFSITSIGRCPFLGRPWFSGPKSNIQIIKIKSKSKGNKRGS